MSEEPDDLSTKKGKTFLVLNQLNTPVVANDLGQTIGGHKFGKVSVTDSVAKRAIESGFLSIIS